MSAVQIQGNASGTGTLTIAAPNTNTNQTLTLPDNTGTLLSTASTFGGTGPAFSVYTSTATALTTSTFTKVVLNNREFDTASAFDITTNNRFQPTVAGYYQINQSTAFTGTLTRFLLTLYKNGSEYKRGVDINVTGYAASTANVVYLNGSTDYLESYVYVTGTGVTIIAGLAFTNMSGALIRAA